jgi:chromosomal replication initiator protein
MSKTAQSVWENCLAFIKDNIQEQAFKTWFEPIKSVELTDNALYIQVPSKFFYEWLEEHYVKLLKVALTKELGKNAKLLYKIKMENTYGNKQPFTEQLPSAHRSPIKSQEVDAPFKNLNPELKNPFVIPGIRNLKIESQLNPNYSFDNFLEGDSNRLARSAGMAVANKPGGTSFNPLLIFGGVGLGKTHLAHAIGVEIKDKYPEKTVLYISAEVFTQQYIDSVKKNNRNDFIHFYQLIDVLIIDDVQFFIRAEKSQDAFFSIFNHLHQSGKQLILTSDKPPKDLEGVQERLLSRFRWGLSADLQVPDYETKIEILEKKMKNDGLEMPREVVKYIAYNINSNVRELEGALISLLAQSSLNKREIDLELSKKVLRNFVKSSSKEITIDAIQKMVCEYFDVPYDKLLQKTRKREIVQARQITMFLAKAFTKNSLKTIGEHFGGRDHTTVIHSCQTVKDLMDTDSLFKESVMELQQKVQLAAM